MKMHESSNLKIYLFFSEEDESFNSSGGTWFGNCQRQSELILIKCFVQRKKCKLVVLRQTFQPEEDELLTVLEERELLGEQQNLAVPQTFIAGFIICLKLSCKKVFSTKS